MCLLEEGHSPIEIAPAQFEDIDIGGVETIAASEPARDAVT